MTKEEFIKKLMKKAPPFVNKEGLPSWLEYAYQEGYKEAISTTWHDISELPDARDWEYILVIYKDTTCPCVAGNKTQVSYWDRVDKWCYLKDILPKNE